MDGSVSSWVAIGVVVCTNLVSFGVGWGTLNARLRDIDNRLTLIEGCFEIQLKPKSNLVKVEECGKKQS